MKSSFWSLLADHDNVSRYSRQAKSRPRQMAEMQFLMDRDNAKYAKESWKTLRQCKLFLIASSLAKLNDTSLTSSLLNCVKWRSCSDVQRSS